MFLLINSFYYWNLSPVLEWCCSNDYLVFFCSTPTLQAGSTFRQGSLHVKMKTGESHQRKYQGQLCHLRFYSHSSSAGYTKMNLEKSRCTAWSLTSPAQPQLRREGMKPHVGCCNALSLKNVTGGAGEIAVLF